MRVRMHGAGRVAIVGCAAAMGTMLVQAPAFAADPVPTTSAEAKVLVDKLTLQQHAAEDQYNKVNEDYTKTSAVLDERTAAIQLQSDKVSKLRSSIGSLALSRYHNRGQETTQALVAGNTEDLIHKLSTIDHVDATLNSSLQNLQSENSYLTELNRQQAVDAAKSKQQVDQLADLDKSAKDNLSRAEALLGQLTEADRQAYEEAERKKAEEEAASRSYNARTSTAPTPSQSAAQSAQPAAAAIPTASKSASQAASSAPAAKAPTSQAPATQAPSTQAPAAQAPATTAAPAPSTQAPAPSSGGLKSSANARGNVYTPGSCVWYAYNVRAGMGAPVGSSWGSALSWPSAASAEGFRVDHSPQVGAVFSTLAFGASPVFGHAGVVTGVNGDGSFTVSDMNNPSPFVVTSHSFPASAAGAMFFIH